MPFLRREVIQGHALEIISRSQVIQGRCTKLLAANFASKAPRDLAYTIIEICSYLEQVTKVISSLINWSSSDDNEKKTLITHLQDIDYIIRELGSHVRYVDGARTQRLPWSVVKPFEKFAESLIPGITIMLRPQWKYNYSVVTTDIRKKYLDDLSEYEDFLPTISIKDTVFKNFSKPFHIVAFPSIERKTILLHCLLGHEIGHLISSKYFTQQRIGKFLTDVRKSIAELLTKKTGKPTPDLFTLQQESQRATIAWIRGLEEILSDIVGALLFGPAVLFSSLEMAIQDEFDWIPNPKNSFYPPWRFRLREIQKIIEDPSQAFFPLPKSIFISDISEKAIDGVNRQFELIKKITENTKDRETIKKDEVLEIVYIEVDKDIVEAKKLFSEELKDKTIKSKDLYKRLHHLIKRLDSGIPPNAFEHSIDDREPANIIEIINAAWFHKISWEDQIFKEDGAFNDEICKRRDIMNRLTLKAIEYAELEKEYRKDVGTPKKYLESLQKLGINKQESIDNSKKEHAGNTLTKEHIIEYMNSNEIENRLIITPLLNPFESFDPAAIDVRLGNEFIVMRKQFFPILDISHKDQLSERIEKYQEKIRIDYKEKFVLHPNQLIIGSTFEYISLPNSLMCYVIGKSSWGRMGLIIATATKVDPGFKGAVTLEIINEGEVPVVLYPGIPIAQLVFHKTTGKASYSGTYNYATGPQFPDFNKKYDQWKFWYPDNKK